MTANERELLDGIDAMGDDATAIGLCASPFMALKTLVSELIAEKDKLFAYREPKRIENGKCPSCGTIADPWDKYCCECGQRLYAGD